jgi:hypothetical protein
MTHFHANYRTTAERREPRSLGTFHVREDAATALLQVIGRRLTETGWITREAVLSTVGLGIVQIENLVTGEEVTSSVWGCGCESGTRDLQGTDRNPARRH